MFGTAALFAADPDFASAADVAGQRTTSGDGYRGDGGFDVNSGSTCGSP